MCDTWSRFAHRLLRVWEAELRMGADDAAALLGGAIERAWALGAPPLAPLAPLAAALLRGHMLRCFVPAYAEYTLAEERRVPPPSRAGLVVPPLPPLPPPPPAARHLEALPPLVEPAHAAAGAAGEQGGRGQEPGRG